MNKLFQQAARLTGWIERRHLDRLLGNHPSLPPPLLFINAVKECNSASSNLRIVKEIMATAHKIRRRVKPLSFDDTTRLLNVFRNIRDAQEVLIVQLNEAYPVLQAIDKESKEKMFWISKDFTGLHPQTRMQLNLAARGILQSRNVLNNAIGRLADNIIGLALRHEEKDPELAIFSDYVAGLRVKFRTEEKGIPLQLEGPPPAAKKLHHG